MKILPSDDLSHKPDYNRNFKKYFKREVVDNVNTSLSKGLMLQLLRILLQRLGFYVLNKIHLNYFKIKSKNKSHG